jgi:hypothetical protein
MTNPIRGRRKLDLRVEGHPSLKVEKQDAKCGEAHRRERESESETNRKEEKRRNLGFRASEIKSDISISGEKIAKQR